MFSKKNFSLALALLLWTELSVSQQKNSLWTLKKVIQTALANSLKHSIIQKGSQSDDLILDPALTPYNWTLGSTWDHPQKDWSTSKKSFYWISSTFLQKKFSTGTDFQITYFNNYGLPQFSTSPFDFLNPSSQTGSAYRHRLSFQVKQNFLRNFFGREDRLKLKSVQHLYKSQNLSRKEELKQLILTSAEYFWNSYIAYIQLRQARQQIQDYKKLSQIARKKNKLGHSTPGETPQILSQLERTLKHKKQVEVNLKNANIQLKTFLQKSDARFRFKTHKPQTLPKKQNIHNVNSLNTVQIAHNNFISQTTKLDSQKYFYLPYIQLKVQTDLQSSHPDNFYKSFSDFRSQRPQFYAIGVELSYPLISAFSKKRKIKSLKSKYTQAQLNYQDQIQSFSDQLEISWNSLKNSYQSMRSSVKIEKLQSKALKEIQQSYIQGRASMNDLISAQDRKAQMDLEKIQAQKNYNLSLLKFYALRDQLLSRYQQ